MPFQLGRRVRAPFILALLPGGLEPHDLNAQSLELRLPGRGDVDTRCRRSQAAPREQRGFQRQRSAFFSLIFYCMDETTNYTYHFEEESFGEEANRTNTIDLTPCQAANCLCTACCTTLEHACSSVIGAHVQSLLHVAPVSRRFVYSLASPPFGIKHAWKGILDVRIH